MVWLILLLFTGHQILKITRGSRHHHDVVNILGISGVFRVFGCYLVAGNRIHRPMILLIPLLINAIKDSIDEIHP